MKKNYNIRVTSRPARGRSRYYKENGTSGSAGTVIQANTTTSQGVAEGHSHKNLADLDRISIDENGYGLISGENSEQPEKIKAGYADNAQEATHAVSADNAQEAAHAAEADEAQHAASAADLDADSPVREEFLSRKKDDTASGLIKFLKGILSGNYKAGTTGGKLDANGDLEAAAALVRGLLQAWGGVRIGKGNGTANIDADGNAEFGSTTVRLILSALGGIFAGDYEEGAGGGKFDKDGNIEAATAVIRGLLKAAKLKCPEILTDSVSTELFTDGFAGEGFRLWKDADGATHLTVDTLTARRVMTVFELLIARIRSVGGTLFVSAANGKVAAASRQSSGAWLITFEDEYHGFAAGDYMRCQTFRGNESKAYWVRIDSVAGKVVTVPASQWIGQSTPEAADEVVLCGSDNTARQSGILISATEDGKPRIEVLNGISGKSFNGCLRVRLGYLDDIVDEENFPGELSPKGYGIYSDNAYFKGEFVLSGNDGGNIRTLFAALGDRITAVVADVDNKIASQITVEAGKIKSDVIAELTGADGAIANLQTQITQNAEAISAQASKVDDNTSAIAQLELTADGISAEITKHAGQIAGNADDIAKVSASISATAEQIRSELKDTTDAQNTRISSIEQTADGIKNTVSSMQTELDSQSGRISSVEQTADGLNILVSKHEDQISDNIDSIEDLTLNIKLTAEELRSEISDNNAALESKISQTAKEIRSEIKNNTEALESSISQTADSIKAEVTDGLNSTGIDIENGLITLKGNTKVVDSNGKETAVFKDGKISASLIDADNITSRRVEVQYPDTRKPCVTILPETKAMRIYDSDSGEMAQELSGIRHTDPVNRFYGGTLAGQPITFTKDTQDPAITLTGSYMAADAPVAVTGTINSASNVLSLIMGGGTITVKAESTGGAGNYAEAHADFILQQLDASGNITGEVVVDSVYVHAESTSNGVAQTKTQTLTLTGKSIASNAPGRFRLAVDYWGMASPNGTIKVSWASLSASYGGKVYRSNYFANGYLLGDASDDYVTAYHDGTDMTFEARMGEYGIRMTRNGLRMLTAAGNWDKIPLPFYRGFIRAKNGVLSSTTVDTMGRYSINPTLQTVGSTGINVVLPSQWKSLRGGEFINRIYVRVFSSSPGCRPAVAWWNDSYIRIDYTGTLPEEMLLEIDIL